MNFVFLIDARSTDGGRGKPYNAHACAVCVEVKKRGVWMDGWMDGWGREEEERVKGCHSTGSDLGRSTPMALRDRCAVFAVQR